MTEPRPLKIGDKVLVGRHPKSDFPTTTGYRNWNPQMERYVGFTATIVRIDGIYAVLDVDAGLWSWLVEALTLFSEGSSPTSGAQDDEHSAMLKFFGTPSSRGWAGYSRRGA